MKWVKQTRSVCRWSQQLAISLLALHLYYLNPCGWQITHIFKTHTAGHACWADRPRWFFFTVLIGPKTKPLSLGVPVLTVTGLWDPVILSASHGGEESPPLSSRHAFPALSVRIIFILQLAYCTDRFALASSSLATHGCFHCRRRRECAGGHRRAAAAAGEE